MQENRLITTRLTKSDKALAQSLAVNLYHIICIQDIQMQITKRRCLRRNTSSTVRRSVRFSQKPPPTYKTTLRRPLPTL
jgi:hypothetical protein